jgi:two-component system LytT family sensor kinase
MAPDYESIWTFSPFVDLSVYRWVRNAIKHPRLDWQTSFFLVILLLSFLRIQLGRAFPHHFFSVYSPQWAVQLAIYACMVMVVAIPLKIFNSTRMEMKLEEQERMLLQARMEALQSQINPHFLFNTLNSLSSLVRFDPDTARELIVKLANILRRLLRKTDAFVPLQEELNFIDDYLDIEVVRFGKDKLKVIKELDPASLDVMVPSMLLQPLVENSIKHGLSPKIEGGRIHIRSKVLDSQLIIEVEDDGVGMGAANFLEHPTGIGGTGIGMANVVERLKVLYGDTAGMTIDSRTGEGTLIRLRVPILATVAAVAASPAFMYESKR